MDAAGGARRFRGAREQRARPSGARHRVPGRLQGRGAEVPRAQRQAADRLQDATRASSINARSSRASSWRRQAPHPPAAAQASAGSATSSRRSTRPRPTTASRSCPGVYSEEPSRSVPVDQPECAAMFEVPDDGDAPVADLRAPGQVPERAQPDRDHRRLARRPRPRVRPEVQPPDGGHGPQAQGRADRGRPAQEGRHPRRPRRRLPAAQRLGRAGRLQRRRRRRDQRLPAAPARHRPTARTTACSRFASDHGLYDAHRGVRQRRLRHLPGLGPRGPLQALRHRDPQRQLARQRARLLGHGGQRHAGPTTRSSTTTTPASPTTRSPPATRACRRTARSGPPTQVYSNNENYFTNDRDAVLQGHAVREAPQEDRLPAVPGAGRLRVHPLRRQRRTSIQDNAIYDNWRSGVRLFWVPAAIRGENDPAKQFDTSNGNRFIGNQMGVGAGRQAHAQRRRLLLGRAGHRQLLAGQRRARRQGHERPRDRCPPCPTRLAVPARPTRPRPPPRRPAPRGTRTTQPDPPGCTWFTTPPKPAAMKWAAGSDRPAPRGGGRAAARSATATAGSRRRPRPAPRACSGRTSRS